MNIESIEISLKISDGKDSDKKKLHLISVNNLLKFLKDLKANFRFKKSRYLKSNTIGLLSFV